jgi:hypothetical protein
LDGDTNPVGTARNEPAFHARLPVIHELTPSIPFGMPPGVRRTSAEPFSSIEPERSPADELLRPGRASPLRISPESQPGYVLDGVLAEFRDLGDALAQQASTRREVSEFDAAADALDYAARALFRKIEEVDQDHEYLTPEQYADQERVTPQTVRNWIRKKELQAKTTSKGHLIPRRAKRLRKGKAS